MNLKKLHEDGTFVSLYKCPVFNFFLRNLLLLEISLYPQYVHKLKENHL